MGEVIHSKVDLEGKTPRVYVATEKNIIASINAKNGKTLNDSKFYSHVLFGIHYYYCNYYSVEFVQLGIDLSR